MSIDADFVRAVDRDLNYWIQKNTAEKSTFSPNLISEHSEILQTALIAVALPATQHNTFLLFEAYYNLVERFRLEAHWLPILEQLSHLKSIQDDSEIYHNVLFRLAALHRLHNQIDVAAQLLLNLLSLPLNIAIRGKALLDLSVCRFRQERLADAIQLAECAYKCFDSANDRKWQGSALLDKGRYAIGQGDFVRAERHLLNALSLEQELGDSTRIVRVLTNLGLAFEKQDKPWHALRYYFEAKEYVDDIRGQPEAIQLEINIANIHNVLEQYDKAEHRLRTVKNCLLSYPHLHLLNALTDLNLGVSCYMQGKFDEALRMSNAAAQSFALLDRSWLVCRAKTNVGDAQLRLGQVQSAQMTYVSVLSNLQRFEERSAFQALRDEVVDKLKGIVDYTDNTHGQR